MKYIGFVLLMLFLTTCSYVVTTNSEVLTPVQAIEKSAMLAPEPIKSIFQLKIKSTSNYHGLALLNSELDSLDQRNLVIALRPQVVNQLQEIHGKTPEEFLMGKNIRVDSEAKRIKTWVMFKQKNTKQYYYQTKVFVKSLEQLTVL